MLLFSVVYPSRFGREVDNIGYVVAVDAMGGDNAPEVVVSGALEAASLDGIEIHLVGREDRIKPLLDNAAGGGMRNITLVNATEVVEMNEMPTQVLRKKDSSIGRGLELLRDGKVNAFFSAGNSGALVAGGNRTVGLIDGVVKTGLLIHFPTRTGEQTILLDAGCSMDYSASDLNTLAYVGRVYSRHVVGRENPRIGLLNIGEELFKGNEAVRGAYKMLKGSKLNFVGNVEPNDIPDAVADVVVCDGFVGNVILKTAEGAVGLVTGIIKQEAGKGFATKIGGLLLKPAFNRVKKRIDWKETGGAVILGLRGNVLLGHGRSDAKAIRNGIKLAHKLGQVDLWRKIQEELKAIGL